ncbi:hypothetical protein [Candidatus Hodgkinia cicadicola]|uniref:hypothetical protein n=1 Tax=Candidatus Hodgkinia cicadicola TaxID=573658 RepID=UPI0011BAB706
MEVVLFELEVKMNVLVNSLEIVKGKDVGTGCWRWMGVNGGDGLGVCGCWLCFCGKRLLFCCC